MSDSLTPEQERELQAMEAGAEGRPVGTDLTEFAQLAHDLTASRPEPEPDFVEKLDRAVEESFSRTNGSWFEQLRRRFGMGRRILLPATAGLAGVLVVATVVVAGLDSRRSGEGMRDTAVSFASSTSKETATANSAESTQQAPKAIASGDESGLLGSADDGFTRSLDPVRQGQLRQFGAFADSAESERLVRAGKSVGNRLAAAGQSPRIVQKMGRKVAAAAQITLGTDPDGVQDVANDVIKVVDEHNGIVMDSSVSDGEAGTAGAEFNLSIPSGQVESAISDLSGIADLRERTQETEDITAPFNTTSDRLKTSRARIKGLLGELENAYTDEDRQRVERRLRNERWTARHLQQRMNRLEKRVNMTPISVSVVTDENGSDNSGWGVGDAFDDAGRLLGIAAGVMLIALAISIPIGLMVLIVLAINRGWVRRARNRALNGD